MLLGVKTYNDKNFITHFKDKVDFIEIMSFADKKDLPNKIVIHSKHSRFEINPANIEKEKINLEELKISREIADFTNAKQIIVHPGLIENDKCSEQNAINLLKKVDDKRIIIENMPKMNKSVNLCSTPEETKKFMEETNKKLCFDINHAISAAFENNLEPYTYLEEFIKLKPIHIHLGGHTLPDNTTHLALTESNIDLKRAISLLPENSQVCLEVTQDIEKTEEDVKLFRKLWNETH